ncbi:MAG: flp pilus-assembly TadE/G-like family protein [Nocardioidaceae bacterium]|nr:flp pilus-assembly TadE/G-like family protein [Nocardioidaceae bacterium]
MTPRERGEHGAATVAALALTSLLLLVAVGCVVAVGIVLAHRRAQAAADLAALAAAQALQHGADGCAAGREVARAQQAALTGCVVDGEEVMVVATVRGPHLPGGAPELSARARAGPGP